MNSLSDNHGRELDSQNASYLVNIHDEVEATRRMILVQWLNSLLPSLGLPTYIMDDELRARLSNGTVLCQILNKLLPGSVSLVSDSDISLSSDAENVKRFLAAMDRLGLHHFEISDLEKGSMKAVVDCLLKLRAKSLQNSLADKNSKTNFKSESPLSPSSHVFYSPSSKEDQRKISFESKFQCVLRKPVMAEPSAALIHHVGHKFQEVFQVKHGSYADLPAERISEMMRSNSLDNAPTQSLLSVVNGILDESVERRNNEIPPRVACLLRRVIQEIERRISTQAEYLRTQNNRFKAREEKYQSRIRVLDALASGIREESEIVASRLQQLKTEKTKEDAKKKADEDVIRLMKEQDDKNMEISMFKHELDTTKKTYESQLSQLEAKEAKGTDEDFNRKMNDLDNKNMEISMLKQELETTKKAYELRCSQLEAEAKGADEDFTRKMKDLDDKNMEISMLKQELETTKKAYELQCSQLEAEAKGADEDFTRKMKDLDDKNMEISMLKQELETTKRTCELRRSQLEAEAKGAGEDFIGKKKDLDDKNMEISMLKQELETTKRTYELRCSQLEAKAKGADEDFTQTMKDLDVKNMEISMLKQELETTKKTYELQCSQLETEAKGADEDFTQKMKDLDIKNMEISMLKQELETTKKTYELQCSQLEAKVKGADEDFTRKMKDLDDKNMEISVLKQELETTKKTYELQCSQLEAEAKGAEGELEQKSTEYKHLIEDLRSKVAFSESKYQNWIMKKHQFLKDVEFQFISLQQLKVLWGSIKQDIMQGQSIYSEECNRLGVNLKSLVDAAESYHVVLAENRRLFNEVQELKGNIRVYCRIRPFIPGQKEKRSIVEHIGDNELVVANPSKQGKDALRSFKFNKVFAPASTQAEVYSDIQAFIRSVLDGYNVCIFAYGQTGSGKTYTMSGPNGATEETLGVNYRALNDLFSISKSRTTSFLYDIGVQMVEIYNEQVRDLLLTDGSPRKLGIMNQSPSKGVAVPDARMVPVKSPSDVMKLMELGLKNRAMSATAMNERSSRSHSVVSIHVQGTDLKSDSTLHGNLHLVDLAGSERVDRSEVTGDRLREAQHINKSLSALGDVIFALSQKSPHVPYRNSKLTQLLQSSLGGQAKTLMFVQLNPDVISFTESLSALKFAERVSGVELGAARSSKEGRDARELMEQVASLKDTISKKDEEIDRLQLLKDLKNVYPGVNSDNHATA